MSKTTPSDSRLKSEIKLITDPLDALGDISGISFTWNTGFEHIHKLKGEDVGVIAQDVEQSFPKAVVQNKETGFREVNYEKLTPLLIECIKELKNRIIVLEKKVK
tara:strand:- start:127 stop:441 length:315 start_codon:yes stop_codon:yes gene_type:complete